MYEAGQTAALEHLGLVKTARPGPLRRLMPEYTEGLHGVGERMYDTGAQLGRGVLVGGAMGAPAGAAASLANDDISMAEGAGYGLGAGMLMGKLPYGLVEAARYSGRGTARRPTEGAKILPGLLSAPMAFGGGIGAAGMAGPTPEGGWDDDPDREEDEEESEKEAAFREKVARPGLPPGYSEGLRGAGERALDAMKMTGSGALVGGAFGAPTGALASVGNEDMSMLQGAGYGAGMGAIAGGAASGLSEPLRHMSSELGMHRAEPTRINALQSLLGVPAGIGGGFGAGLVGSPKGGDADEEPQRKPPRDGDGDGILNEGKKKKLGHSKAANATQQLLMRSDDLAGIMPMSAITGAGIGAGIGGVGGAVSEDGSALEGALHGGLRGGLYGAAGGGGLRLATNPKIPVIPGTNLDSSMGREYAEAAQALAGNSVLRRALGLGALGGTLGGAASAGYQATKGPREEPDEA
jgi:hypothetical protein